MLRRVNDDNNNNRDYLKYLFNFIFSIVFECSAILPKLLQRKIPLKSLQLSKKTNVLSWIFVTKTRTKNGKKRNEREKKQKKVHKDLTLLAIIIHFTVVLVYS